MQIKTIVNTSNYSITGNSFNLEINESGIMVSIKTLSNIIQLSNYDKIKTVVEYFPFLKNDLNIKTAINFSVILGKEKSKEYFDYIKEKILLGASLFSDYHLKYFLERKKCYQNLSQVAFENKILETPVYHHISTTGRTSIKSGHNFLTMKKTDRIKLKPVNNDDVLIEMDFKSCEPFFYLISQNILKEEVKDIYTWIANKINIKIKNRDKFKRGVLSIIYGASDSTVKSISQISKKDIAKIKSIMVIDDFKSKLELEYEANGFIRNYYGRPIKSNANIVNYWIQSSAADFCSLAFNKFREDTGARTCFLIHDSITFLSSIKDKEVFLDIDFLEYENVQIPVKSNLY